MQPLLSSDLSTVLREKGRAQSVLESQSSERAALIAEIKASRAAFLKDIEAKLCGQKEATQCGIATGQQIAAWHDQLVQYLAQLCFPVQSNICLIAVGGYGFGNLCASSDLDLLFLSSKRKPDLILKGSIEVFLYLLWDLGFKVGHATCNVSDCLALAREDHSICSALLTRRQLFGSDRLSHQLADRFEGALLPEIRTWFVEKKFAERDARHKDWGGSRYALEPNVKESKGGLRDLDCLIWIAKAYFGKENFTSLMKAGILTPSERNATRAARNFLLAVRHQLHFMTRGRDNRLLFDHQEDVATRLGYVATHEGPAATGLMRNYFHHARTAGELTRILSAALEQSHKQPPRFSGWQIWKPRMAELPEPFVMTAGRLDVRKDAFEVQSETQASTQSAKETALRTAEIIVRLFRFAQTQKLNLHPDARRLVWRHRQHLQGCIEANGAIGAMVLQCLSDRNEPDETVRKMSEAGCLGQILPEWGRVEVHPQFDRYHSYTVGEHTIQVIHALRKLESGQYVKDAAIASDCLKHLGHEDREVLYVAAFLHDIGKGYGVNHSEKGAEIAARIVPMLGLNDDATALVVWLVRHHLALSNAALKRDPDSPETALTLAKFAKSAQRLNLLLCLTTADIMGIGPGCWTSWKNSQITRIYTATLGTVRGQAPQQQEAEIKRDFNTALINHGWGAVDRNRFFATSPETLWATLTSSQSRTGGDNTVISSWPLQIADLYRQTVWQGDKNGEDVALGVHMSHEDETTKLVVCGRDRPGLFADLAGAIAYAGLGIHSMRLHTFSDGGVLDVFVIFGRSGSLKVAQETRLRKAIQTRKRLTTETSLKPSPGEIPTRVRFDTPQGATHTILEITAQDRSGLTHDLAEALEQHQLRVYQAQTMTWGKRTVQTYYVRDRGGRTLKSDTVTGRLSKALTAACSAAS